MRHLDALSFALSLCALLCLLFALAPSAQAATFDGSATEHSNIILGVGVVVSFALGWLAGGQR